MFASKTPRIITRTNDENLVLPTLNQLFAKAGQPVRDLAKLEIALQNSLLFVTARILRDDTVVGFVRVTGDGVFNAAIWDFVVDPSLSNGEDIKKMLLQRLKQEIRRTGLQCSVTIFAQPEDVAFLQQANFSEDQDGIQAMALRRGLLKWRSPF
ncbi:MAG: GNAT family N-acetyltransferase [Cyanobacteria bacterium P01_A01_bin.17]